MGGGESITKNESGSQSKEKKNWESRKGVQLLPR